MASTIQLLAGVVLGAVALGAAAKDERIRVDVERESGVFQVRAQAEMAADPRVAWDTLVDYEKLPQFVPGVHATRVVRRSPNDLTVEYSGEMRFWFVSEPVFMRLAVKHEPYAKVLARSDAAADAAAEPTVRKFFGRYELAVVKVGGSIGVRLTYDAEFETARALPPLIGLWAVREMMRDQFEAMVHEIERRNAALARGTAPGANSPAGQGR